MQGEKFNCILIIFNMRFVDEYSNLKFSSSLCIEEIYIMPLIFYAEIISGLVFHPNTCCTWVQIHSKPTKHLQLGLKN